MRSFRNAPRVVDIDVLVMEGTCVQEDELTLPHPRMADAGSCWCRWRRCSGRPGARMGLFGGYEDGEPGRGAKALRFPGGVKRKKSKSFYYFLSVTA